MVNSTLAETKKKYTYEQALTASKKYFFEELPAKVFVDKYAVRDKQDNLLELTPDEMHDRLAGEFARIDYEKYGLNLEARRTIYKDAMRGFARIMPQGSPMSVIGNTHQVMSASNCVVVASPEDSIAGIMKTGTELAHLYRRRAGVGVDISTLRPEGFATNNASRTSSGAWSFADFFSYVTRMIGQQSRRGACMITMDVHHPDIVAFSTMKKDKTKVTGANVSVRLTDEFLSAVDKDELYEQRWPCEGEPKFTRKVKAREVWDIIIKSAHESAEPGLIFWDRMTQYLPAHSYPGFKSVSTNPCCFSAKSKVNVITKEGIKLLKDITKNDLVWVDSAQKWCKTSGYFYAGVHPTFEVKFSNGITHYVTGNHKYENFDTRSLMELNYLKVGDNISCSVNPPTDIDCGYELVEKSFSVKIVSITPASKELVGCIEVEDFHKFTADGVISGNSEICLSPYDSCRLISINLTGYIKNAFEKKAQFDWNLFHTDIRTAVQMCDNLVDLELELIDKILGVCGDDIERSLWRRLRKAGEDGRRTGLGTHGLGDALAQLNIKYDSDRALDVVEKIYSTLRDVAYDESIELAKSRGPFPVWSWDIDKTNRFIQELPEDTKEKIQKYGRRNISQLTQAPTGSVSIVSKCGEFDRYNVSSGIEPVFKNYYIRRKKINQGDTKARVDFTDALGDKWQEFPVFHPNVKNYLEKIKGLKLDFDDESIPSDIKTTLLKEKLPEFFVTADQIDWKYRVKLQGIAQQFLDHSISSTINIPKESTVEIVGNIYLTAWKERLKGITVYVAESRSGVLVEASEKTQVTQSGDIGSRTGILVDKSSKAATERPGKIKRTNAPKRPPTLPCDIYNISVKGKKWTALVGLLEGEPYEVFMGLSEDISLPSKYKSGTITKNDKGKYTLRIPDGDEELVIKDVIKAFDNPECAWATRLLSMALRHGADPLYIEAQLSKEGGLQDINKVLARIIKKYIKDGKVEGLTCKNTIKDGQICGSKNLFTQEGCITCQDCGFSKCN